MQFCICQYLCFTTNTSEKKYEQRSRAICHCIQAFMSPGTDGGSGHWRSYARHLRFPRGEARRTEIQQCWQIFIKRITFKCRLEFHWWKKPFKKKKQGVGMVTSLHSWVGGTNRRNQFCWSVVQSLPQIPKYLTNQKWNGRRLSSNGLSGRFTGKRGGSGGRRGRPKNTTLASTGRFDLPRLLTARLGRRLLYRDLAAWLCLLLT